MEAFAQYEGDFNQMLNSNAGWAAVSIGSVTGGGGILVGQGRDGGDALRIGWSTSDVGFTQGARITLPADKAQAFIQFGYLTTQYPADNDTQRPISVFGSAGVSAPIFRVSITTAGAVAVYDASNSLLGTSANGVIVPGSKQAFAVHFIRHASAGDIEVRIDKISVLHLTGLALGSTDASLITFCRNISTSNFHGTDIMDVFINDASGSENNTWAGDPRLTFLRARADYALDQGWAAQRRYMFGNGVLQLPQSNACLTAADASAVRVGSGDFTIEGFYRFTALPTGSNKATIFGKWVDTGDLRSWQLFYGGASLNSNHLELRVSTDGMAGTITSPISVSWSPIIGRRYFLTLQVESGKATLYIDGVRQNAPQTMPVPADTSALFVVGGQQENASGPAFTTDASFVGFIDEFRFTKGVARYGSGFTVPVAAFGRNSSDDPDYSSVVILAGFDNSVVDESASPRILTVRNNAARYAPDDGPPGNYKVILHGNRDDTFLEAAFLAAQGLLTFTVNATTNDTVVVDGVTYTFKNPFVNSAGNVLIGATADDSINNLVAAINGDAGAGTLYGTATTPSSNGSALNRGLGQLEFDANTLGSAGNAIATTSSNGANTWSGATLSGGTDLPDPSAFVLDRLPPHTVSVLAADLIHRSRKTDSGDCSVQPAFIVADGSSANGTDQALTTNFIFYNSLFETDPSTSGGLTPSSFINSRVRLDRTA